MCLVAYSLLLSMENERYASEVYEDCKKLLPRMVTAHKRLEASIINEEIDEAVWMALAMQIDLRFDEFDKVDEWFSKLMSMPKKRARR